MRSMTDGGLVLWEFSKLFITFVMKYVIINHGYLFKQNVELEQKRNWKNSNDG